MTGKEPMEERLQQLFDETASEADSMQLTRMEARVQDIVAQKGTPWFLWGAGALTLGLAMFLIGPGLGSAPSPEQAQLADIVESDPTIFQGVDDEDMEQALEIYFDTGWDEDEAELDYLHAPDEGLNAGWIQNYAEAVEDDG
ncbi:MAG: hypothetical protein CMH54_14980 [Myxococcales bacterium]|nr:hypothetical protein [Myxococcales bacterium]|tara:strand:+ start:433 stop:858 length:426 start_codon:yes stop_codon:yes gene_type:complete